MAEHSQQRRQHRLPMQIQVQYSTVGEFVTDWTSNVSIGGMYIQTENPLAVGTRFRLQFVLPGFAAPLNCTAQVRWIVPSQDGSKRIPGMGVCFEGISEAMWKRVRKAWEMEDAKSSERAC